MNAKVGFLTFKSLQRLHLQTKVLRTTKIMGNDVFIKTRPQTTSFTGTARSRTKRLRAKKLGDGLTNLCTSPQRN